MIIEWYLRQLYKRKLERDWKKGRVLPEWFDHRIDLYLWWKKRTPYWVERGVFSRAVMEQDDVVLDLCCGDGFYSYHFYSGVAQEIDAVDRDRDAIRHARKYHSLPNIAYHQTDIITGEFPQTSYDVIVWDGAIEHFSPYLAHYTLQKCHDALVNFDGILCGYTIIPNGKDWKTHPNHDHEFESAAALQDLLLSVFPFAATFETIYPDRHNLYFRAGFDPFRLEGFRVEAQNSLRRLQPNA